MEIRLLHIEDRDLFRAGVRSIFADSVVHLIGSATTVVEAYRLVAERNPDIVLLNIRAQSFNGVDFLRQFRRDFPKTKVVILTSTNDSYHMSQASILGAVDYLNDDIQATELLLRIQNIYYEIGNSTNEEWNSLRENQTATLQQELRLKLTNREEQVLRFLTQGMSNKEIASQLQISAETVKEHVQHILRKIGARARTEAAVWAVKNGIV